MLLSNFSFFVRKSTAKSKQVEPGRLNLVIVTFSSFQFKNDNWNLNKLSMVKWNLSYWDWESETNKQYNWDWDLKHRENNMLGNGTAHCGKLRSKGLMAFLCDIF